jgi:hypothetical protein
MIKENICGVDYRPNQSHDHEQFVRMTDRTLVQTGANCPRPGSYMVENFGPSVRNEI